MANEQTPAIDDLHAVYKIDLTGQEIDLVCNYLDLVVKSGGGLQAATVILPLVEKLTAPRVAAMAARPAKPA